MIPWLLNGEKEGVPMKESERTIAFGDRPVGVLYEREVGMRRWLKVDPAVGEIRFDPECEYRLRTVVQGFGVETVEKLLASLDCTVFTEIVVPVRVSRKDLMDQAMSGEKWVDRFLKQLESEYATVLNTKAKIVVKAVVR